MAPRSTTFAPLALLLALAGCSTAPQDASSATTRSPIVGGVPADNRAIVQLVGRGPCTGALIAPNVVLTAKHCVTTFKGGGPFECDENGELVVDAEGPVYVGAGEFDQVVPAEEIQIGAVSPYAPRGRTIFVSEGDSICRSDTAVIVLDRPVDDPEIVPLRLDAPPAPGETLTTLGFGQHEDGGASATLLSREVTVIDVGPKPREPGVAGAVRPGFFTTTEGLCRGDSGSAALSPGGAAVGVASSVGREDLDSFSGTAQDCIGDAVRASYESVAAQAELIETALASVGAQPWHEGEPDPRGGLAGFEDPCESDDDCRSLACVPYDEQGSRCSQGCLSSPCPEGYRCEAVDERQRCIWTPPVVSERSGTREDGGCSVVHPGASNPTAGVVALLGAFLLFARRRRKDAW